MNTQEIIDAYNMKRYYIDDKNYYKEKIREAQEQLDITNSVLEVIERIKLIYNNKPISEFNNYPNTYGCSLVEDKYTNSRYARLYLNQHNKTSYGVYITLNSIESWLGSDIKTFDEAKRLCLEFVSGSSSPQEFKYDYERNRI